MSAPLRRGYVDGRFGQIHYRIAAPSHSSRRPLLLFHMSPYSGAIYERFAREIGRDRTAIAIDTPGFGASDPPPTPPEIADYAGCMGEVMDALGFRDVDLMGYHTGSKIALEVAIQRPSQVHRIVMVSATVFTAEELAEHKQMYGPEDVTDDGSHFVKWWKSAQRWRMKGVTNEALAERFAIRMQRPSISWWGHRAAFNYLTAEALPKVAQPILILNPEDDLVAFTPRAKPLLKHRDSRIHDLPRWSHGFLDLKTEEAATIVRQFLDARTETSMERRTLLTSILGLSCLGTAQAQTKPIVLLAGATGKNGSVILAALKKSSYTVRAMSRNAADAAAKFGKDVEWISADVTKPETLPAALKGVSYVIDAVAARGKEGQDSPESVDLGGTKNLAAAAKAAGVKRFVIITSSVSGEVDNPLNKIAGNVIIFKGKAEEALIASGVPYTIIGPGGMNNQPGGAHEIKMLPRAEYVKNTWITREDTAAVAIEALTNPGAANKAFSIVNGDGPATGAWKQAFARMPAK